MSCRHNFMHHLIQRFGYLKNSSWHGCSIRPDRSGLWRLIVFDNIYPLHFCKKHNRGPSGSPEQIHTIVNIKECIHSSFTIINIKECIHSSFTIINIKQCIHSSHNLICLLVLVSGMIGLHSKTIFLPSKSSTEVLSTPAPRLSANCLMYRTKSW